MADTRYTRTYACTNCGAEVPDRDKLTVKKASFHNMGAKARTIRSRVVHWLCPACLKADPDWNRPAYSDPAEAGDVTVGTGGGT
jgi:predicted RNA-binding Zn-ribbon protein involved in translation (DUF1610 family)